MKKMKPNKKMKKYSAQKNAKCNIPKKLINNVRIRNAQRGCKK